MSDDHLLGAYEEATTSIDRPNEVILSLQPAIFRNGHGRFARGYSHFDGFAEHVCGRQESAQSSKTSLDTPNPQRCMAQATLP
jgi:hypothetical protein